MIVNFLDARNILRRNNRRLPGFFVGDHTAEMNIAVTYKDAESEGCPIRFLDACDYMISNVIVVGSRIRNVAREFRNGLKQIGARYDSDKLIPAHHWQPLDIILFHKL